jgi:hypothetical protein
MHWCCPPGHGCNASNGSEACALALFRAVAAEETTAARALARWNAFTEAEQSGGQRERRFRRRSYERARNRALIAVAMRGPSPQSDSAWTIKTAAGLAFRT